MVTTTRGGPPRDPRGVDRHGSRGDATAGSRLRRGATIAIGAVVALLGMVVGFSLVLQTLRYSAFGEACAPDGCSTGLLTTILIVGVGLIIFGWAITTGLFVVRLMQRRRAWFWPPLGILIVIAAFYLTTLLTYWWTTA
jgi:hypothetical protein